MFRLVLLLFLFWIVGETKTPDLQVVEFSAGRLLMSYCAEDADYLAGLQVVLVDLEGPDVQSIMVPATHTHVGCTYWYTPWEYSQGERWALVSADAYNNGDWLVSTNVPQYYPPRINIPWIGKP